MKHNELVTIITKETGKMPTQQDFADILNLTRSAISSRAFRNKQYSFDEVMKIANYYNVNLYDVSDSNKKEHFINDLAEAYVSSNISSLSVNAVATLYPDVFGSCGNGTFVFSENKEIITIPKKLILNYSPSSTYSVINAYGDSMFPSIQDKDRIIVEHWNGEQIRDNKIYVFCYQDMIFVKRLIRNIDEIIVISDNPNKELYPIKKIVKDDINNVFIIGKIVGLIRNLD